MNDKLSYKIIGCAMKIFSQYGPGLFESTYEKLMMYELAKAGLHVESQVPINIRHEDLLIEDAYRADIVVNNEIIIELKSVEGFQPVHFKQLLTYLRLTGMKVGLLINFNVDDLKKGIKRVVNNY